MVDFKYPFDWTPIVVEVSIAKEPSSPEASYISQCSEVNLSVKNTSDGGGEGGGALILHQMCASHGCIIYFH